MYSNYSTSTPYGPKLKRKERDTRENNLRVYILLISLIYFNIKHTTNEEIILYHLFETYVLDTMLRRSSFKSKVDYFYDDHDYMPY